ncbi:MAG: Gfo/Idh/MocA family oxidoreductase [Planctomycetes bacterium]|nr:Gfo/Idh/MocA family oxidoreductase [Planctomycetota bacterium]MCB9869118.1 Gfo/Idh/MocA family oxidoreductase [Planctomycetota bacterium]
MAKLRVLVVGCGNMGTSHARAYRSLDEFELVGLVSRGPQSRERLAAELGGAPTFGDFAAALRETAPDCVSINTYPDTHFALCRQSLSAGAHVFAEKPLANTVAQAEELVAMARERGRKLMVGYILRVHPAWQRFIEQARTLGKPLVMRMNLNQQSRGKDWETHKALMNSISPIVDCGVHYVDVMCQMTGARPLRVSAIGARLSDELVPEMYNYGQLQVTFDDGSVGWYEAGWGPMMSEVAFFVKDVVGPRGCVSIVDQSAGERAAGSADVASHTATSSLRVHWAERDAAGMFARADQVIDTGDEPDHDGLCRLEQQRFARAILGDEDLTEHLRDAVNATRIVLAADEAFRSGRTVELG